MRNDFKVFVASCQVLWNPLVNGEFRYHCFEHSVKFFIFTTALRGSNDM